MGFTTLRIGGGVLMSTYGDSIGSQPVQSGLQEV